MCDPFLSWNGKAPDLSEDSVPMDLPTFKYPEGFATRFNEFPVVTFDEARHKDQELNNAHYAGPYIFHCKGITASAVTRLIFSHNFPLKVRPFLFFYFSSITLDYMKISDAAVYCLSRIAFPDDRDQLADIFVAFADAYATQNPYTKFSTKDVSLIAKACVIASGYKVPNGCLTKEKFELLLSSVNISKEAKAMMYDAINATPVPLFFTFSSFQQPPQYNKTGMLKKTGGLFKSKKDRLFVISSFILKYYHDKSMKEQIGELEIGGTISSYVPKQKKEDAHLLIKNKDGKPIGYKIVKDGSRKKSNHNEYIAYADNCEDIIIWESTLNLVAFWKLLIDIPSFNK